MNRVSWYQPARTGVHSHSWLSCQPSHSIDGSLRTERSPLLLGRPHLSLSLLSSMVWKFPSKMFMKSICYRSVLQSGMCKVLRAGRLCSHTWTHGTVCRFCFLFWFCRRGGVFCHWNGFLLKWMSLADFFLAFLSHDDDSKKSLAPGLHIFQNCERTLTCTIHNTHIILHTTCITNHTQIYTHHAYHI